ELAIVVSALPNRLFKDGWVGGDAAQIVLVDHALKLAGSDQAAPDIVVPDALAALGNLSQSIRHKNTSQIPLSLWERVRVKSPGARNSFRGPLIWPAVEAARVPQR